MATVKATKQIPIALEVMPICSPIAIRIMKTKKGGKAVRGFAKKKKQANKMRKK